MTNPSNSNHKETIQFKTEVNQLLDLMIHSLYSHKEIFLRELISNASDAITKLSFASQTDDKLLSKTGGSFKIKLIVDKEQNTLTIVDNGIGMNREDIISNIGTIAKSGSKDFLTKMKEAKESSKSENELIGQFGVGFYSAFMVADKIVVKTLKTGEEQAFIWESDGKGEFSIDMTDKDNSGTEVVLYLNKESIEYLDTWTLKSLVKKYSDFIPYPINMDVEVELENENGNADEAEKKDQPIKIEIKEETLNSQKALWTKPKAEITAEEYDQFYQHLTHDFEKPLLNIHQHLEGALEFKSLLYIPKKAPFDLYQPEIKYGANLYIKRVFIMNNCQDLLPAYLRFVKGVVDSSDLPLNVSREILQDNPLLQKIKNSLIKKILSTLKDLKDKEYDKYVEFYKEFGKVLKEGVYSDYTNKEQIQDLLLFESTATNTGEYVSLQAYIDRMPTEQTEIYYITGENKQTLANSPHLEAFKQKSYEVIFMTDPIDEWIVNNMTEHNKKSLKSVIKGDINLTEKKSEDSNHEQKEKDFASLLDLIKETLKDDVKEVKVSHRLVESPCCLVVDAHGMTAQMEKIMASLNKNMPKNQKILEINIDHPILQKMHTLFNEANKQAELKDYAQLLYDQAILAEGGEIKNPSFFLKKMNEFMVKNLV